MKTKWLSSVVASLLAALAGCAAEDGSTLTPTADDDALDEAQVIYSTNAVGTWSASASVGSQQHPSDPNLSQILASASFTGPAYQSRRMGVCGLRQFRNASNQPVACATAADCGSAPTTLPSGGFRYCTAPNGAGTKYCHYRPGTQTDYCAGSPANGGLPVAVDGQGKLWLGKGAVSPKAVPWISYACFEGCAATDPSSSSTVVTGATCNWYNGYYICM